MSVAWPQSKGLTSNNCLVLRQSVPSRYNWHGARPDSLGDRKAYMDDMVITRRAGLKRGCIAGQKKAGSSKFKQRFSFTKIDYQQCPCFSSVPLHGSQHSLLWRKLTGFFSRRRSWLGCSSSVRFVLSLFIPSLSRLPLLGRQLASLFPYRVSSAYLTLGVPAAAAAWCALYWASLYQASRAFLS
jgi:hypothetical protein